MNETQLLEIIKKHSYIEAHCSKCNKEGYYFYPEGTKVVNVGDIVSISTIKHSSCGHTFYELLCTCGCGSYVDKNSDDRHTCSMCKKIYLVAEFDSHDVFEFLSDEELPANVKKILKKQNLVLTLFFVLFILLYVVPKVLKFFGVDVTFPYLK